MEQIVLQKGFNQYLVGNICVKKKEELKEFLDGLIKIGYYESSSEQVTFGELFEKGYYCDVRSRSFISKMPIDFEDYDDGEIVTYRKNVIRNRYLDVILIFSSLLGELKAEDYDEIVTKMFIESGIFASKPLNEIWDVCLSRILRKNQKSLESTGKLSSEYIALKMAFDEGIIQFEGESLSEEEVSKRHFFKGISLSDLRRISRNSDFVFGPMNSGLSRKRK